jgi:hypothetical protein
MTANLNALEAEHERLEQFIERSGTRKRVQKEIEVFFQTPSLFLKCTLSRFRRGSRSFCDISLFLLPLGFF